MPKFIDIVFDGLPSHDGPRFVEVENGEGRSIKIGEWIKRDDGYAVLRIPNANVSSRAFQKLKNRIDARLDAYLCEMKPNYDDSIMGFNEAWDIVRAIFKEEQGEGSV